jgi:hypothetical protein
MTSSDLGKFLLVSPVQPFLRDHIAYLEVKSKSKLYYDWQSVDQAVLVSGTHLGPATNFFPFCLWLFFLTGSGLLMVWGTCIYARQLAMSGRRSRDWTNRIAGRYPVRLEHAMVDTRSWREMARSVSAPPQILRGIGGLNPDGWRALSRDSECPLPWQAGRLYIF